MKMLMIVVDSSCKEELEVLLRRRQVAGYTEVADVHGVGETGIRMGSRAFPKTSSLFLTAVPDDAARPLRDEIVGYCEARQKRMRMFSWSVEELV